MNEPIPVDTATLAAALSCTPAHVRRLTRSGVLHPIGTAPRRGRGGRPSHLFDLRAAIATLHRDTPDTTTQSDV